MTDAEKAEKERRANTVVLTMGGVDITRRDVAIVMRAARENNTVEVISLDHPFIRQVIGKGLVRPCKLRCGIMPVAEPGITLTEFGRKVAEHVKLYHPDHQ
jgi:hypothetical protein